MARKNEVAGISVGIDGDTTGFQQSMNYIKRVARSGGVDAAKDFGTAFSKPMSDALSNLSRNFLTAKEALKWNDIKLPIDQFKDLAAQTGIATDKFQDLAERMAKNSAWEQTVKSFRDIKNAANLTDKELEELAKDAGLSEVQFERMRREIDKNNKSMKDMSAQDPMKGLIKKVAAATISIAALKKGLNSAVDSYKRLSSMGDMAMGSGLPVEDFSRLAYSVETAGGSMEGFRDSWQKMQKALSTGGKDNPFSQLGLDLKELRAMRPQEQLSAVADAVSKLENQGQKVKLVEAIFGQRGARELLPLLNQGSAEIKKLGDEAERLGQVVTADDVARAKSAADAINRMGKAWQGFANELALKVAPAVEAVANGLTKIITPFDDIAAREQAIGRLITEQLELNEALRTGVQIKEEWEETIYGGSFKKYEVQIDTEEATARLAEIKAEIAEFEAQIQSRKAFATRRTGLETNKIGASANPLTIVDPAQLAAMDKFHESLQRQLDTINAAGDATKLWDIQYQELLKQAGEDTGALALIEAINQKKREQITLEEEVRKEKELQAIAEREAAEIARKDAQYADIRLQFWREYGELSAVTMDDINRRIQEQSDIFREAQISEVAIARWAADEKLKYATDWKSGAIRATKDYYKEITDTAKNVETIFRNAFSGMEDALVDFISKGELDFSKFIDTLIADLVRFAVRQAIIAPLLKGTAGFFGLELHHSGGIVGKGTDFKSVNPLAFTNAPRFHSGGMVGGLLNPNEVPIIAQRGEMVLTKEQQAALGANMNKSPNVNVQVVNNTPADVKITQQYNGNGELSIRAQIDDAMAGVAASRGSNFNQTVKQQRRLIRR